MALKLYNTRTRAVEPFVPLRAPDVRIYVCGLTPSARAHLGHARSFLFFDLLRRYLTHLGYRVTYVQNVTDIDDRSIARAKETGEDWHAIVEGYYAEFKSSMYRLGWSDPDVEPQATQFISQIQAMIRELVDCGYAYATPDGIYYRVCKFPGYGKLSGRNIDELQAGARIDIDEHKDDPLDFALWKYAKPDEPKWPFDGYGDGRPGWHIECSAMSHAILDPEGVGFDIHGGGADLIFPHHENEIAQSEPLMARPPMANVWVHGGLLNFDGHKMSKSLGNFEPLSELLDRHDPQAVRLTFLSTGYSKVMNFTEESIASANATLERLKKAYRIAHAAVGLARNVSPEDPDITGYVARIERALDEDMNTSVALAELLDFAGKMPQVIERVGGGVAFDDFAKLCTLLGIDPNETWLTATETTLPSDLLDRLGAALAGEIRFVDESPEDAIALVLSARKQARAQKDWAASDRLRDALLACGVAIKDGKEGTTWTANA